MKLDQFFTAGKGLVGATMPIFGIVTSMQAQIEWALRVTSLLVGILVGVVTIWSIIRKSKGE